MLTTAISFAFATSTVTAKVEGQKKCSSLQPRSVEVTAPEFDVVLRDNDVIVRGTSYVAPGAAFQGFEWTIDLKNCTYRTERIRNSERVPGNVVNEEYFNSKVNKEVTVATGSYLAGIKIVTKDPPGYWLAATTNKLYWTTYSNGTVQWYSSAKGCTGYTTPLSTHWYVSSCQWPNENPYYSSDRRFVYSRIQGSYYNYDFLDTSQRTDARHYSKITGNNNGSWLHQWSATHSGEFYWLLRGEVVPAP